jgi:hypothetical protein
MPVLIMARSRSSAWFFDAWKIVMAPLMVFSRSSLTAAREMSVRFQSTPMVWRRAESPSWERYVYPLAQIPMAIFLVVLSGMTTTSPGLIVPRSAHS